MPTPTHHQINLQNSNILSPVHGHFIPVSLEVKQRIILWLLQQIKSCPLPRNHPLHQNLLLLQSSHNSWFPRIGGWSGKAIVDTGASYTMIHESLWQKLSPQESLQPWSFNPLYLANGEAEVPLGWLQLQIHIHNKIFTLTVAVLSPKALAYAVVLGLDFIFFSGLQINVIDKKYSFKSTPQEDHPFQPGNASVPDISPQRQKTEPHAKIFNQSL